MAPMVGMQVDVDLTGDTSSSGDELVLMDFQRDPLFHRIGDDSRVRDAPSSWDKLSPARTQLSAVKNGNASPSPLSKRTPNGSPAAKSAASHLEVTPSKSARFAPTAKAVNQHLTPQSAQCLANGRQSPSAHTPTRMEWTVEKIAAKLATFVDAVGQGHARLAQFMLEEAEKKAPQPRHLSSVDFFADMKSTHVDNPAPDSPAELMAVKFKQHSGDHGKPKGNGRKIMYPVVCIKTDKKAVPKYRFHHVEIRKNILTPNTMLNFVPHLRDVDPNSEEEKQYSNWLTELEKLDSQSGFKTEDRQQKTIKRMRDEYAATLSMYLEPWLRKLNIDGCTKSTLIRYMASQPEQDTAITPQQKSHILDTYGDGIASPQTARSAKMFTEAFDSVFNPPLRDGERADPRRQRVSLKDVLKLDKSVEVIVSDNKRVKETPSAQRQGDRDLMPKIETSLASYSILGCLICFSHDCEHGEFDADNQRGTFSVEGTGGLARTLREKWVAQLENGQNTPRDGAPDARIQCGNSCYRRYDVGNNLHPLEPWSESEILVLEQVFATIGHSPTLKAQCFVGAVLGRKCWEVYRKLKELNLTLPHVEPRGELPRVKPLPWYDRKKKQLLGDWQDHTVSHEHAIREISEPCHHDGPCTKENDCPCASHHLLCERFCHCTADECARKFVGCACHSAGKTCLQRQKEGKPCICVQLNRECDPVLCSECGATERADPENAHNDHLHSTGCQNVSLQRGAPKAVMIGQSQLDGCGYGLFTAENIAQDEFVIEYTGELISHDEGVRREARRGNVFDETSNSSYLFTLLENEGIWVDAAIYGNMSRYINHASEYDRKGCNITPKILYVNGEFRIKFSALREIKAGEELFFNYGDNFPNLTKKLLDRDEDKQNGDGNNTQKRQRNTARKTTTKVKGGKARKTAPGPDSDDDAMDWITDIPPADYDDDAGDDWDDQSPRKKSKKRGGRRPGAGRKKKPAQQQTLDGSENSRGASIPVTEISDSQDEGNSPQGSGALNTPSRRRFVKKHGANPSLVGSESEAGFTPSSAATGGMQQSPSGQPLKKISKRGGARPGAGRKPKHPRPPGAAANPPNNNDKNTNTSTSKPGSSGSGKTTTGPEDSDEQPLMRGQAGRGGGAANNISNNNNHTVSMSSFSTAGGALAANQLSIAGGGGGGGGRKRKAPEIAATDDEDDNSRESSAASPSASFPVPRGPYFQPIEDIPDEEEDDPPRKRQKQMPSRYRS